jgi:hypothetical protein
MKKIILLILCLLPVVSMVAQENKWRSIILDEVLTISLPAGFTQQDTSITDNETTVKSRIIQSNTGRCNLYVKIDSANVELRIHDRKSALISLEGIVFGICESYSKVGYRCERSDTVIDRIPGKKIFFYANKNDLTFLSYIFRANNKTYSIFSTLSNDSKDRLQPKDLNKLLASLKFNSKNIKEYKFYSQSKLHDLKAAYTIDKMIIHRMMTTLFIEYISIKI